MEGASEADEEGANVDEVDPHGQQEEADGRDVRGDVDRDNAIAEGVPYWERGEELWQIDLHRRQQAVEEAMEDTFQDCLRFVMCCGTWSDGSNEVDMEGFW